MANNVENSILFFQKGAINLNRMSFHFYESGKAQRFAVVLKIWPQAILCFLPFNLRTNFWKSSKSWDLKWNFFQRENLHWKLINQEDESMINRCLLKRAFLRPLALSNFSLLLTLYVKWCEGDGKTVSNWSIFFPHKLSQ